MEKKDLDEEGNEVSEFVAPTENPNYSEDMRVLKAVVITILVIVFIIGSIIGGLYYKSYVYSQGVQDGAISLYEEIISKVGSCEPWPIYYGNQSVNLIIYECLEVKG